MFPYMSHGIEFLLTNFTGKFLFCISMDNLDMFMKGPEFLERFITGNTLSRINRNNLYLQGFPDASPVAQQLELAKVNGLQYYSSFDQGLNPGHSVKVQSPNRWTAREVP